MLAIAPAPTCNGDSVGEVVREEISPKRFPKHRRAHFLALNPRKDLGIRRRMVYLGRHEGKEQDRSAELVREAVIVRFLGVVKI